LLRFELTPAAPLDDKHLSRLVADRRPRSRSLAFQPAQIPASCRTSAFADSLAAPQQTLIGASYCFAGIGSVSWLVAAALLPFPSCGSES
jgi:hypothetical protein